MAKHTDTPGDKTRKRDSSPDQRDKRRDAKHDQKRDAEHDEARDKRPNENSADEAAEQERQNPVDTIPLSEWIVAAIGAVLVIGVIGFMVYQAVAGDTSPPNISIQTRAIHESENGFLVEVTVINQGGQTAGGLLIEGELSDGEEAIETSQATLSYVPAQSQRSSGLFFTEDPRQHALKVRALGYETP